MFQAVSELEPAFFPEVRLLAELNIRCLYSVIVVQKGHCVSTNYSILQKLFRVSGILASWSTVAGHGVRPLGSFEYFGFFAIARLDGGMGFASLTEHCPVIAALFCERRLLLPLIERRRPPSKRAQKRPLADGLPPSSGWTDEGDDTRVGAMVGLEAQHGTAGAVRQCAQYGLILASCNVLVGADGGNRSRRQGVTAR